MTYRETHQDLNKRFSDSWINFREEIIYCHGFDPKSDGTIVVTYTDSEGNQQGKAGVTLEDFKQIPVNFGLFNIPPSYVASNRRYQSSVCKVTKNPTRHYTRGWNSRTMNIKVMGTPALDQATRSSFPNPFMVRLTGAIFNHIVKPVYPSYAEAWRLCEEQVSQAFCSKFFHQLHNSKNGIRLLGSEFGFIGESTPEEVIIKHRGAGQEFMDWMSRNDMHTKIRVTHAY